MVRQDLGTRVVVSVAISVHTVRQDSGTCVTVSVAISVHVVRQDLGTCVTASVTISVHMVWQDSGRTQWWHSGPGSAAGRRAVTGNVPAIPCDLGRRACGAQVSLVSLLQTVPPPSPPARVISV